MSIDASFGSFADLVAAHARERPGHVAVHDASRSITYAAFDRLVDRIAAALQRDRARTIAIAARASIEYVAVFVGALRAGVVVAPLPLGATPGQLAAMIADADASLVFNDARLAALEAWLAGAPVRPAPVEIRPELPFNIIYSSGTTGAPKGIVQPHSMRWGHVQRGAGFGYGRTTITLLATPLYSNTTLVALFPTLGLGGTVVLMDRFDARGYLELAARHRVTHTMLVPVQYQRIMALPEFDRFDLGAFEAKFCTSAPFSAALKADVLARWPGKLIEFYGMTEGGGTFILLAREHPDKLHTVGRAAPGHDIRLIDEEGREVSAGEPGEIVGHSAGMMTHYHKQPEKTRAAEWFDATGKRFIRTGDVGRLDADGFLVLMDRRKDMIISGGFNIFPSDLEQVLASHPSVAEVAVVGVPSERWGETPVAFVVARAAGIDAEGVRAWANERLGKMQRIHAVRIVDALPRSTIGKVLKRELREAFA